MSFIQGFTFKTQKRMLQPAGIFRNNGGGKADSTMAQLFDRVLPASNAALRWDMAVWVPAAVVINLATNDLGAANGPFGAAQQKLFVKAYKGAMLRCNISGMYRNKDALAIPVYYTFIVELPLPRLRACLNGASRDCISQWRTKFGWSGRIVTAGILSGDRLPVKIANPCEVGYHLTDIGMPINRGSATQSGRISREVVLSPNTVEAIINLSSYPRIGQIRFILPTP